MFSGYGETPQTESQYCTEDDISMEHIERLANQRAENFLESDTVFLSIELYEKLKKDWAAKARYCNGGIGSYTGPVRLQVNLSVGVLAIKAVPKLYNFCYVGTETSFKRLEWIHIDEEFEKVFFGEKL